jgi:thiamine biosynthesis lipoprotein
LGLRWARATARRLGTAAFLLEAGGDLVACGEPPEGGAWRVALQDPTGAPGPLAVIAVADEAITTSSVRLRRWTIGEREVHHLIDPRTGEPGGAGLLAVTVAGPDPAWSEVWSKTLFLEGRTGVAALARRLGLAAWWVADDGSLEMTAAARARTIWVAAEDRRERVPRVVAGAADDPPSGVG